MRATGSATCAQPVLFGAAVQRLIADGHDTFIEMSPHPILIPAVEEGMRDSGRPGLVAVPSLRRDEDEPQALMNAVAALYCAGHPVVWDRLYDAPGRHAELPAYPWQRERHWFEAPSQLDLVTGRPVTSESDAARQHPLLRTAVGMADQPGARAWEFELDDRTPRHWRELAIGGKAVVPPSAWLDLLFAAGRQAGARGAVMLTGVVFDRPMFLPPIGARIRLQIVSRPEGPHRFSCRIYRRTDDGWTQHVAAMLNVTVEAGDQLDAELDLASLPPASDGASAYASLERSGYAIGPSLQAIGSWWSSPGRVLARVELPPPAAHEQSHYDIHPALVDAALQAAFLDRDPSSIESGLLYPASIARAVLSPGDLPVDWATASRGGSGDVRYACSLVDSGGHARLALSGVQMKPLAVESGAPGSVNDWLYTLQWIESPAAGLPARPTHGTWVIAGTGDDLSGQLAACLRKSGYDARDAHDRPLDRAIAEAAAGEGGCAGVVCMAGALESSPLEASSRLARAALDAAVTVSRQEGRPPRLWLVTRGAQGVVPDERVACEAAAVWGIGRTLAEEHPEIWGGLIDLDPLSSPESAAAALFATVTGAADRDDQVAFRGGRRYVLRLARTRLDPTGGPGLRPNATYVIAGGLGDLGLKVAHWMVESGARRLVLLGRTPLPPRGDWDRSVTTRDQERIAAVRRMEALGATIRVDAVDISDRESVQRSLGGLEADGWPAIAGVMQCAGVLEGQLLGNGDERAFENVWLPKARGTVNLDAATAALNLDFFVLFSSMASFLPSPGQASYAAANAFLDAFASDATGRGRRVIAVNWGPWADIGMASALSRLDGLGVTSRGFASLGADQALAALSRVLSLSAPPQIAVMSFDWAGWHRGGEPIPLFADLAAADLARAAAEIGPEARPLDVHAQLAAAPTSRERRTVVEELLRDQVARVLKRPPSGIELTRPFRAMGLDSLMALEMRNRLEALVGLRLPATLAWNHPTIAALASFLASKLGIDLDGDDDSAPGADAPASLSAADQDEIERLLAEIEPLSDADARRLMVDGL